MAALKSSTQTHICNKLSSNGLNPVIESRENGCESWGNTNLYRAGGEQSMDNIQYMRPRIRKDLLPRDFFKWGNNKTSRSFRHSSGGESLSFLSSSRPSFSHQSFSSSREHEYSESESEVSFESVNSNAKLSELEVDNVPEIGGSYRFRKVTTRRAKVPLMNWNYNSTMPKATYWPDSPVSSKKIAFWSSTPKSSKFSRDAFVSPEPMKDTCRWRGEGVDRGGSTHNIRSPVHKSPVHSDGSVNKELYHDLVEMIPLMETFMGKQERSSFPRRGSLIHTPVPSREDSSRKLTGTTPSLRSSRRRMRFEYRDTKGEDPIWVEQLNHLRRIEVDEEHSTCENALQTNESMPDLLRLQSQIDELNHKLWEKDCLLQSMQQNQTNVGQDAKNLAEITRLQNKVEDLKRELAEKDQESQSTRHELEEKLNEIAKMKSDMEVAKSFVSSSDESSRQIYCSPKYKEELNELRCQVAALRYQLEITDLKHGQELMEVTGLSEEFLSQHSKDDLGTTMLDQDKNDEVLMDEEYEFKQCGNHKENLELTKRQYFAALIVAREKPGEESLAPAAEFRTQLERVLGIPSFSSFVNHP